ADHRLSLLLIDDHMAGAKLLDIIAGPADGDRAGMMEAMPDRGRAALYAVDLDRDDRLAEHGDDAVQRPHPSERAIAPAHRLGPGEIRDDALHGFGKNLRCGSALALDHREQHAAAFLELLTLEAGLAQEPLERLRRRVGARALHILAARLSRVG